MDVLFLDMDGVMNSMRSAMQHGFGHPSRATDFKTIRDQTRLDENAVDNLCLLLAKHDFKVVISSTWRERTEEETREVFNRMFRAYGLPSVVIGSTPHSRHGVRGEEIAEWLSKHPEVKSFVILDDDSDMTDEQKARHFVHTNIRDGLTEENCAKVMSLMLAQMAELADAPDSKSDAERCAGSTPALGTT